MAEQHESSTELHPSAERAIAELSKPLRVDRWDTVYTRHLRQRSSDLGTLHDLMLDALTKISKGRGTGVDYLIGLAAEALEAHGQTSTFIEERDAAAEAAEEAADRKQAHARRMLAHLSGERADA